MPILMPPAICSNKYHLHQLNIALSVVTDGCFPCIHAHLILSLTFFYYSLLFE